MKLGTKLTLIFTLALFIRLLPYSKVFKGDTIFFDGPDAYYHMKRILLTVQYFPSVPTFDPYTNYPQGGQIIWPPLFDFFIALIAKLVGVGNPSQYLIEATGALVPPILGALTVFLVYQLAREIFNSTVGIFSALFLAVLPAHVTTSTVGTTDHHVAEVFCSTLLFVALLKLTSQAILRHGAGSPVPRLPGSSTTRDSTHLQWLGLGIGTASCILVWQGSVVFVGYTTLYLLAYLGYQTFRKTDITPLLHQIVKAYLLALVLIGGVTYWNLKDSARPMVLTYVTFSWFHFLFTLLCLILILFLSVVSHRWSVVSDRLFVTKDNRSPITNHSQWTTDPSTKLRAGNGQRTAFAFIFLSFCLIALVLLLGVPILKGALYLANQTDEAVLRENGVILSSSKAWVQTIAEYKPLFFINGSFDTSHAERFLSRVFYFIPFLWIYFVVRIRQGSSKESYKLFFLLTWTLLSGFMIIFQHRYTYLFSVVCSIYLGFFAEQFLTLIRRSLNQWRGKGSFFQTLAEQKIELIPTFLVVVWALFPSFQYLSGLSKLPVGPPPDIYQTLLQLKHLTPEPGNFYNLHERPQYGILANWSFGRWINYIGQRPAIADNDGYGFQESTQFFLAESEDVANQLVMEKKARYILVYDLLRALPHYATVIGLDPRSYFETRTWSSDAGKTLIGTPTERFYSLMQTRLYEFDGSAIKPVVNEAGLEERFTPALEHYRFLYESDSILSEGRPRPVHLVKVFEYIAGANIIGKTRPETPVSIFLNVQTNQQRIFSYWNIKTSDATGNFRFTVPYPTDGSLISVKTSNFYLLKCGAEFQQIQVSEETVRDGGDIVLERTCE